MSHQKISEPEERGNPLDAVSGEFQDGRGRLACPYSMSVADMLTTFKPHFASRKELKENHGICKKCADKIKKRNAAIISGKKERAVIPEAHIPQNVIFSETHLESTGLYRHHHEVDIIGTTDFDFDQIDAALHGISNLTKNKIQEFYDAFEKLFIWCFSENRIKIAAVRFAVIGDNLYPELIGSKSNKELARQLGVSRQVFSKTRKAFKKHFQIRLKSLKPPNRRNKSLTAS